VWLLKNSDIELQADQIHLFHELLRRQVDNDGAFGSVSFPFLHRAASYAGIWVTP